MRNNVVALRHRDMLFVSDDLLRHRIGDALRRRRREAGRILEDVARAAGVSPSHLSEIERGTTEASSEVLRSIHRSLGLSLDELLGDAQNHRPQPRASAPAA